MDEINRKEAEEKALALAANLAAAKNKVVFDSCGYVKLAHPNN
jgi:hypothetical protein